MDEQIYKIRLFTLIAGVLLIGVIGYNVYSFATKVSAKADQRAALEKELLENNSPQAKNVSDVTPEDQYSNPLDETNQYDNPFEDYQNPFDQ